MILDPFKGANLVFALWRTKIRTCKISTTQLCCVGSVNLLLRLMQVSRKCVLNDILEKASKTFYLFCGDKKKITVFFCPRDQKSYKVQKEQLSRSFSIRLMSSLTKVLLRLPHCCGREFQDILRNGLKIVRKGKSLPRLKVRLKKARKMSFGRVKN